MKRLIAAAAALCILAGGCGVINDNNEPGRKIPAGTLQPVETEYTGKVEKVAVYFLNGASGTLTAEVRTVVIGQDTNPAEVAVRELLKGPSNGDLLAPVAPQGMSFDRMEYSRGVANVYLNYAGEPMDPAQKFRLELAITDTVTDVLGAAYVSVFYNGAQSGYYPGIPYGPMVKQTGNLDDIWNQASAKYLDTPVVPGEQGPPPQPSPAPSESAVPAPKVKKIPTVLYFISSDGGYLLPEVRNVKYTDGDYIKSIIAELGKGPQSTSVMASPLSNDVALLEDDRITPAAGGGYRLTLDFRSQPARDDSDARGVSLAYASIVYSITGFVPDIVSTEIFVNGKKVADAETGKTAVSRSDYSEYVGSSAPVYFADRGSDLLLQVSRSMEQDRIWSAKQRVLELIDGPLPGDGENAWPVVPEGITDADILSVKIYSDTAYVNLSGNFANRSAGLSSKAEMLLVYSIVNTITAMDGINKVQFLVEGRQAETLAGSIALTDPFLRNYGIIKESS